MSRYFNSLWNEVEKGEEIAKLPRVVDQVFSRLADGRFKG